MAFPARTFFAGVAAVRFVVVGLAAAAGLALTAGFVADLTAGFVDDFAAGLDLDLVATFVAAAFAAGLARPLVYFFGALAVDLEVVFVVPERDVVVVGFLVVVAFVAVLALAVVDFALGLVVAGFAAGLAAGLGLAVGLFYHSTM